MKISKGKVKSKKVSKKKHEWLKALFIAFLILLFFRVFAFQSYTHDNSTMESTLLPGDFILVNKLPYGARMPITLMSIPFVGNNIPFSETKSYTEFIQIPYFRFPGFSNVNHNELIVFNYPQDSTKPIDKREEMIKRCVGLPGDTLRIIDKKVFVNGKHIINPDDCKFRYRVSSFKNLDQVFLQKYNINEGGISAEENTFDFFLTKEQAEKLRLDSVIESVNLMKVRKGKEETPFFPQNANYKWSLDYFGPVVIPSADKTIQLDLNNIFIYKSAIEKHENSKVEIKNDSIYINDSIAKSFTFKMNYFFVMDDNRDNGKDSRYWGFLPENHIIGTASFVWFSMGKSGESSGIRWSRIFKLL